MSGGFVVGIGGVGGVVGEVFTAVGVVGVRGLYSVLGDVKGLYGAGRAVPVRMDFDSVGRVCVGDGRVWVGDGRAWVVVKDVGVVGVFAVALVVRTEGDGIVRMTSVRAAAGARDVVVILGVSVRVSSFSY